MAIPDLSRRVARTEEDLAAIADTMLEIKATVDRHTDTLAAHGRELAAHGRELTAHGRELTAIRETQAQHGEALAEILRRLDAR
ncbi:MAG: hypothetical protein ACRDTJ_11155 [Pseudonocardiaceae bacterium]